MKKIVISIVSAVALCGVVLAADTIVTGYPATTGIGTFKVTTDGTSSTLTVDKIAVASLTNALAGTAYTTNTLTGDGKTNVFIWNTVGNVKVLKSITTTP